MSQDRIIFIPGILTSPELQKFQWGNAAREMFPDREIVVIEKTYIYTQHDILNSICDQVLDILEDGNPTVLLGHSFGGILATAIYWKCQERSIGDITRLVTVVTPHSYNAPGLEEARACVGYQYKEITNIPVVTFGAKIDHVVPKKYTSYLNSEHTDIRGTHSGMWLNPRKWRYRHVWNTLQ